METCLPLDGKEQSVHPIERAHHDFVELPDGSFAVLVEDARTLDDTLVKGDAILLVDPDGGEEEVWNCWDEVVYDPDHVSDDGTGWTHANALDYDEVEDCFYLSLRNLNSIHKISRSGETLWRFGGEDSDFTLSDGSSELFDRQHQFEVTDDSIVIFSNNGPSLAYSEVLEYSLSDTSDTTELLWSYRHDPDLYTLAFGAAERISEGNTLVTWTTAGLAEVVNEEGHPVWSLQSDFGGGLSYMHWTPDLYSFQN